MVTQKWLLDMYKTLSIVFHQILKTLSIRNVAAYALANAAIRMSPLKNGFSINIIYKPYVLDNVSNFFVFNDDQQILHFVANTNVFKDATIEEDEHDKAL